MAESDKCCFCIELRTGCLIIGYLDLIGTIIKILISSFGLAAVATVRSEDDDMRELENVAIITLAILLVFYILVLAFNIVLLIGLHKYKRGHVKAYLIFMSIFLVLYSIIKFCCIFAQDHIEAGAVVSEIIAIFLSIYFLAVIRSYYVKMGDSADKPAARGLIRNKEKLVQINLNRWRCMYRFVIKVCVKFKTERNTS